jgi:hypothetical protein
MQTKNIDDAFVLEYLYLYEGDEKALISIKEKPKQKETSRGSVIIDILGENDNGN